jgi:Flp pilus assembly protein TadD
MFAVAAGLVTSSDIKQSNFDGAIAEFRRSIELDPSQREARASLAQALQKAGRKQESLQASDELRKTSAEASNLGQAMILVQTAAGYSNKGQYRESVQTLPEAVTLSPNFTEARYQLAVALHESGDDKKSEESFRDVLKLDPDHASAHLNLGRLLSARDDAAQGKTRKRRTVGPQPR